MYRKAVPAIIEHVNVPAHIAACARAIAYDLYHGPSFSCIPEEGIEKFTADMFATYAEDLKDCEGKVVETYTSDVAKALKEFIDELPSELYFMPDCEYIIESEPEGEYLNPETMEPPEEGEDSEYFDPPSYYHISHGDIVEAIFSRVIRTEFV